MISRPRSTSLSALSWLSSIAPEDIIRILISCSSGGHSSLWMDVWVVDGCVGGGWMVTNAFFVRGPHLRRAWLHLLRYYSLSLPVPINTIYWFSREEGSLDIFFCRIPCAFMHYGKMNGKSCLSNNVMWIHFFLKKIKKDVIFKFIFYGRYENIYGMVRFFKIL